ncbi:MAG TPA: hypothetical protein VF727_07160 [Allosphingosinicella sp.]|jgi:hypothetical protein
MTLDGVAFGRQRTLTCTWFSNFEVSRFEACRAGGRNVLPANGGAAVRCPRQTCARMDKEAHRLARTSGREPPSGTFVVRLRGRISLSDHAPRHLGEGTRIVLVEKLLGVANANPPKRAADRSKD